MIRIITAALILAMVPTLVVADEVMLTNGHKVEGIVRQNKGGKVVVEVGSGCSAGEIILKPGKSIGCVDGSSGLSE